MWKISYKRADSPGYEWLQVTTNNTSDYKSDYKWLQVNTNKNVRELSFTVISVDNILIAGGKQRGTLASNNRC